MIARLGPYELVAALGQGAAGTVYRARHVELGVERALKVVRSTGSAPGRFGREVRALASVRHPNVVGVHEVSEGAASEPAWLAMDLVEGEALADVLERGPLPLDRALDVVGQVGRGLEALHALGIVHRDVKPANVLLARDGRAVVVDLGMAVALGVDERLTRTGAVVGTPLYLAPELLAGAAATPATDVHALGLLLYECATGRAAYLGPGVADFGGDASGVLARIAGRSRPRPSELDPRLPRALDGLCVHALALDPADRPATGGAFAALVDALRAHPGPSEAEVRRQRRLAAGLGLVTVAVAVTAAALGARRSPAAGGQEPPATSATSAAPDGPRGVSPTPGAGRAVADRAGADRAGADRAGALLAGADRAGRAGRHCLARLEHPAGTGPIRACFADAGHVLTLAEKDGRLRLWALDRVEPVAEASPGAGGRAVLALGERAFVLCDAGLVPLTLPSLLAGPALAVPELRFVAAAPDGALLLLLGRAEGAAEVQRLDPDAWTRSQVVVVESDPARTAIARLVSSSSRLLLTSDANPKDGLTGDASRLLAFTLPAARACREQILPSRVSAAAVDPSHPDRFALGLSSGDIILSDLTIDDPMSAPDELRFRRDAGRDALEDAAHATGVRGVAFTADGRRLVSAASWATDPSLDALRWWDVATGRPVSDLLRPAGPLGVHVSPDGRLVVLESRGSAAEVWAVPP